MFTKQQYDHDAILQFSVLAWVKQPVPVSLMLSSD